MSIKNEGRNLVKHDGVKDFIHNEIKKFEEKFWSHYHIFQSVYKVLSFLSLLGHIDKGLS